MGNTQLKETLNGLHDCMIEGRYVYCVNESGKLVRFSIPEIMEDYSKVPPCIIARHIAKRGELTREYQQ